MSATYKAQDPSNKKRRFENKVYDRRENEKKEQKKKETYAVIEAIVKKTLEGKTSNKRKVSEDLDGFNYDTLNDLSLSDIEAGSDSDSWRCGLAAKLEKLEVEINKNGQKTLGSVTNKNECFAFTNRTVDSTDSSIHTNSNSIFNSLDECLNRGFQENYSITSLLQAQPQPKRQKISIWRQSYSSDWIYVETASQNLSR